MANWIGSWLAGTALGVLVVVSTTLGLFAAILVALAGVAVARRLLGRAFAAGALFAFGALWTALVAGQSANGGQLDNAAFWIAVGVTPLAVGLALTAAAALRTARTARISRTG